MFGQEEFEFEMVGAPSGVSDQPRSNAETLLGARNRACRAAATVTTADFWVGVEGGVEEFDGEMTSFSWVYIQSRRRSGKARSATFFLPPVVADLLRQGVELGEADDRVFGRVNSKQENGAVGILTENVIDRARLYEQAVTLALIPFKNETLYLR
jgi:inosine/xanthosine triphosphatase